MRARPYQTEAVQSIVSYFQEGRQGHPLVSMPTGTGKSIIPAIFMQWALQRWPNQRMLLLTHVKELIAQNFKAQKRIWPTAPAGIFSSGLGKKEAYAPLVFGGVASVVNNIREIGWRDIVFIDEAHLLSPNDDSMYQQTIAGLTEINPNVRVIGLTATPFRMGQGRITDGGLFTDMVFDMTGIAAFNRLIDEYYLSPLVPKQTHNVIDVSDVDWLANDFNQGQLNAAINAQNITARALQETMELAHDRRSWIVFGAGIKNCEQICELLNRMGVSATTVHSKMTDESRNNRMEAFKAGRFRAMVSNNILTTGFDHPETDCIVDLRPTTSVVLHVQKYGRGTRPYFHPSYSFEHLHYLEHRRAAIEMGGKRNCIVLDFAGNTSRLGPINDPRIPKRKGKGTGEVPVKICDHCGAYNHTTARICVGCGAEFVFKTKLKPEASTADIIVRNDPNIKILPVRQMVRSIHKKPGKSDTLKVSYFCGLQMFPVWLSFESMGFPKHKAHDWWRQHFGEEPMPATVAEAFELFPQCRVPNQIKVDTGGKFPEVLEFLF